MKLFGLWFFGSAFGVGLLVAVPAVSILCLAAGLGVFCKEYRKVHKGYQYDADKIHIPAPPPGVGEAVAEKPQVVDVGHGAGFVVYPAGHVRRYEV